MRERKEGDGLRRERGNTAALRPAAVVDVPTEVKKTKSDLRTCKLNIISSFNQIR